MFCLNLWRCMPVQVAPEGKLDVEGQAPSPKVARRQMRAVFVFKGNFSVQVNHLQVNHGKPLS